MTSLDPVQLQKVIEQLNDALQTATLLATHLEKSGADVTQEAFQLRQAISRAVIAVMTLQPRRDQ